MLDIFQYPSKFKYIDFDFQVFGNRILKFIFSDFASLDRSVNLPYEIWKNKTESFNSQDREPSKQSESNACG